MTELVHVQPAEVARTDSWVPVLGDVFTLSEHLCKTEFVPESMRGRPAAVAAAILAGRELDLPPMQSLGGIDVIKGRPGLKPLLMRALILAAGHHLRYVETSDTRCVVEGRRRDSEDWHRVSFTADQAKRAGIALGGYPEDKLVARATARLARRAFADVLGGMPYLAEELADGVADDPPAPDAAPAATRAPAARRTAQRKPRPEPVEPEAPPPLDEPAEPMASREQMTAMAAAMSALDYRTRDDQHSLVSRLLGRQIGSAKEITAQEAHSLLDDFTQAQASGDPQTYLDDLLGIEPGVVAEDPPDTDPPLD